MIEGSGGLILMRKIIATTDCNSHLPNIWSSLATESAITDKKI